MKECKEIFGEMLIEKVITLEDGTKIPDPPTINIDGEKVVFLDNGIKVGSKLYKGWFLFNSKTTNNAGKDYVTFYKNKDHNNLPKPVYIALGITKGYFDDDTIDIYPELKNVYRSALIASAIKMYKDADKKRNSEKEYQRIMDIIKEIVGKL